MYICILKKIGPKGRDAACWDPRLLIVVCPLAFVCWGLLSLRYSLNGVQGRLMEAAQHFRVAADLDPSDVDIHISLGNVLRQDGEATGAIK